MATLTQKSRLVGLDGQPIEYKTLTQEVADAQLTGLRSVWNHTSIASGLNPARLADVLDRAVCHDHHDFLTLAEEMEERDLHYGGQLGTRKRAITGLDTEVEAASDDKHDTDLAETVRGLTERPEFNDMLFDVLDALGKGYSATEIIWDTSAKQWEPTRYKWRDPRFFHYDRTTGEQLLLIDSDNPLGKPLPAYKFIVHKPRIKSGIPIRGALARMAAVIYMCKGMTLSDWMSYGELFGMPIRIGKYGPHATPEEKSTLRSAVANIGSDAAAIIPESMAIELIEAAKASGGDEFYKKLADWLDKQTSKGILGQTMTADDGASLSQAQVHNDVRMDILKADVKQLENTINRDVIKPYIDLNFGPQQRYPRVTFPIPEPEDVIALTNALKELVPLGLKVSARDVREKFALPEPKEGEELLGISTATPPQGDEKPAGKTALNRQSTTEATTDLDAWLEELDDSDWQPQLQPIIDPLLQLAEQSDSADAFIDKLPGLLDSMDASELIRRLATAAFKARGLGDATDK